MRLRDSQRQKLYNWEIRCAPEGDHLSLDECVTLIEKVMRHYHVPMPEVKDGRRMRRANGNAYSISLPSWARSERIVVHEAAHSVIDNYIGYDKVAGHCPEYVWLYTDALTWHFGVQAGELRSSARYVGKLKIKKPESYEAIRARFRAGQKVRNERKRAASQPTTGEYIAKLEKRVEQLKAENGRLERKVGRLEKQLAE